MPPIPTNYMKIAMTLAVLVPRSENYDQSAHRKRKHYIP